MPYVKRKQTPNASWCRSFIRYGKLATTQHTPAPLIRQWLALPLWTPEGLFSGAFDLKDLPSLIVIALICGLERASASLALDALSPEQLNELFNGLQPSWSQIWRGMLPTAFLFGVVKWFIGGFWCHIRAVWCGYTGDDRTLTRAIFLYTEFFAAAPLFAFFVLQTFQYPDLWLQQPQKITPLSCSFPSDSDY